MAASKALSAASVGSLAASAASVVANGEKKKKKAASIWRKTESGERKRALAHTQHGEKRGGSS